MCSIEKTLDSLFSVWIEYTNRAINTDRAMICNSRPRRFGKSITANMLVAYYSKGCDSTELFDRFAIAASPDYKKYLNQYDVIHFDVQWCLTPAGGADHVVAYIQKCVIEELEELEELYGDMLARKMDSLPDLLSYLYSVTGKKFVVVIDEWDVLIRDEAANRRVQDEYIDFLRGMFKGSEPTKFIALAYLTGILPIKKVKTQSALNNFDEFTMLDAKVFAPYIGFTEEEVRSLCKIYHKDFEKVKCWYDGYQLNHCQIYNPRAVVGVMTWGEYRSYWSETGTYESIQPLISMDFDGLKAAIITMMSGERVKVRTRSYQNDMVTFKNKDDVMTSLIHLGYLAYDQIQQTALTQIKDKNYPAVFSQYTGNILLVGINYDKKTKEHQCMIEQYEK